MKLVLPALLCLLFYLPGHRILPLPGHSMFVCVWLPSLYFFKGLLCPLLEEAITNNSFHLLIFSQIPIGHWLFKSTELKFSLWGKDEGEDSMENYQKLKDLKKTFILPQFWNQKSKTKVSTKLFLLETLTDNLFHASLLASGGFWRSLVICRCWFVGALIPVSAFIITWCSLFVSLSLCFFFSSYKDTIKSPPDSSMTAS